MPSVGVFLQFNNAKLKSSLLSKHFRSKFFNILTVLSAFPLVY